MSLVTRIKIWVPGDVLASSDLNGEFNNIINVVNGNIDSTNIGTLETLTFVNNTASASISHSGSGTVLEVTS